MTHFIAMTEKITAERLVKLFRNSIQKLYRLLKCVTLDRGSYFTDEGVK